MTKRKDRLVFGKLLTEINAQMRIPQIHLALRLGVSSRTLTRWKDGRWFPPEPRRLALVAALRKSVTRAQFDALVAALGIDASVLAPPGAPTSAVDPQLAKMALDAAMFEAAQKLDVSARRVRDALLHVVNRMAALGVSAQDAATLLA